MKLTGSVRQASVSITNAFKKNAHFTAIPVSSARSVRTMANVRATSALERSVRREDTCTDAFQNWAVSIVLKMKSASLSTAT